MDHGPLKVLLFILLAAIAPSAYCQSPQGINYQAILRDTQSGEELGNQSLVAVVAMRVGGPNGELVYEEMFPSVQTNAFGLLNLVIGSGDVTGGSFSSIPWESGDIWLELEIDTGEGIQSLGSTQFNSVPYALFAQTTGNVDDADADPTNELITSALFQSDLNAIVITESDGNTTTISLNDLNINDADSDPTNEVITNAVYIPEENTIQITEADGSVTSISLDNLIVDDADSDPTNELIDPNGGLQLIGTSLQIVEAGISYSTNLDALIDDADADPFNELIDDQGITLIDDTILTISEAGVEHTVNLATLRDDGDWNVDNEGSGVFNVNSNIGVGTNDPTAKLEVVSSNSSGTVLKVKSNNETVLYAAGGRLGVGTENPLSSTQFNRSIGYNLTILDNLGITSYTAGDDDYMIIVKFLTGGSSTFQLELPAADQCEGRTYVIRKTGDLPGLGELNINTGSFPVDFFAPNIELDETSTETVVIVSLGTDGWTRILREN